MKHPHYELIEQWINDISNTLEYECRSTNEWSDCEIKLAINDVTGIFEIRVKYDSMRVMLNSIINMRKTMITKKKELIYNETMKCWIF